jgi:hypothetical protein
MWPIRLSAVMLSGVILPSMHNAVMPNVVMLSAMGHL